MDATWWEYGRGGTRFCARWYMCSVNSGTLDLSIFRYKGGFVLVDDPVGTVEKADEIEHLAGPFPTLRAAKVAYKLLMVAKGLNRG